MFEFLNSKEIKTEDLVEDLTKLLLLAADLGLGANFKPIKNKKSKVDSVTVAQLNILSNFLLGKLSSLKTIPSYDEMEKKIKEIGSEKNDEMRNRASSLYLSALTSYYREYPIKSPVFTDKAIKNAISVIARKARKYIKNFSFKNFSVLSKVEEIKSEEKVEEKKVKNLQDLTGSETSDSTQSSSSSYSEEKSDDEKENKIFTEKTESQKIYLNNDQENYQLVEYKYEDVGDLKNETIGHRVKEIKEIKDTLDDLIKKFQNNTSTKAKLDIYMEILELQKSLAYFNSDYSEIIDAIKNVSNKIEEFEKFYVIKLHPKLTKIYKDKILTPVVEYSSYLKNTLKDYNAEAKDDAKLKSKYSVMKNAQIYLLKNKNPTTQELVLSIVNTSRYIENNKEILLEERDGAVIAFLKKLFGINQEDVVSEENEIEAIKWGTTTAQSKLLKPMGLFAPPKEPKQEKTPEASYHQVYK